VSNYRAVKRGMKRLLEPRYDFNVSAARCAFRGAARVTDHPEFGLFGVNLTGNARSVEVGSPNSPEVWFWSITLLVRSGSGKCPRSRFGLTFCWQTTDPR
jgi:hypothetical protein